MKTSITKVKTDLRLFFTTNFLCRLTARVSRPRGVQRNFARLLNKP
jgi:hypothetical protein